MILSRDPTRGDPHTIDQIRVTETIKQGKTIYSASPQEQRKARLMPHPDGKGNDSFARFLAAGAVSREMLTAPAYLRRPGMAAAISASPHDKACVGRFMDELLLAMLSGTGA